MKNTEIETNYEIISKAPIGKYIGDRGARIFAEKTSELLELKDNRMLFKKGDITKCFYIIAEGRLAVVKERKNKDKPPRVLHIFESGDMVGELGFIDDVPRTSNVLTLGDTKVLKFNAEDIRPLILQEPQIMFDFMRAVIKRIHFGVKSVTKQQNALSEYIASAGRGRS